MPTTHITKRRRRSGLAGPAQLALGFTLAVCTLACGEEPQKVERAARQVAALKPVNVAKKRAEMLDARRLYDADKKLLPSDEMVAGIRLPRGVELKMDVENRHYYHSKVPLEQLRAYFGPRLTTMQIVPDGKNTYKYVAAKTKDTDDPHLVDVRIGPSAKTMHVNEIMIRDLSLTPIRKVESFERTQAQLKALREHAQ